MARKEIQVRSPSSPTTSTGCFNGSLFISSKRLRSTKPAKCKAVGTTSSQKPHAKPSEDSDVPPAGKLDHSTSSSSASSSVTSVSSHRRSTKKPKSGFLALAGKPKVHPRKSKNANNPSQQEGSPNDAGAAAGRDRLENTSAAQGGLSENNHEQGVAVASPPQPTASAPLLEVSERTVGPIRSRSKVPEIEEVSDDYLPHSLSIDVNCMRLPDYATRTSTSSCNSVSSSKLSITASDRGFASRRQSITLEDQVAALLGSSARHSATAASRALQRTVSSASGASDTSTRSIPGFNSTRRTSTDKAAGSGTRLEVPEGQRMSERDLFALLRTTPLLTSLRIRAGGIVHVSPRFLHTLMELCPMLSHLQLANVHGQDKLDPINAPGIVSLVIHGREAPDWVGALTGLRHLELHGCWEFPSWFSNYLPDLETLKMEAPLLAKFPASMSKLTSLHTLTLHLPTQEHLPLGLRHLASLKRLNVVAPKLECGDNMAEICSLTNLEQLKVQVGPMLKSLPDGFDALTRLHSLSLQLTSTSWEESPSAAIPTQLQLPRSFWKMSALRRLRLEGLSSVETLSGLGGLRLLETLCLKSCGLRKLPPSFAQLMMLSSLRIDECRHLREIPECTAELPCLRSLQLIGLEVKKLPFSVLDMPALMQLKIRGCKNIPACDWTGGHSAANTFAARQLTSRSSTVGARSTASCNLSISEQ